LLVPLLSTVGGFQFIEVRTVQHVGNTHRCVRS
jgi:hypothetical protein